MFTTSVISRPVKPFQLPERTDSEKTSIFSYTALTCGITSSPSAQIGLVAAITQRHMQHCPVFGVIQAVTCKHASAPAVHIDPSRQTRVTIACSWA